MSAAVLSCSVPREPAPSRWRFPDPASAGDDDIVGIGGDLESGSLLMAYRNGMFPMPASSNGPLAWWSPDPRGILPVEGLHVSRSLRKSVRRYTTTIDRAFDDVILACADPSRPHGWIRPDIIDAYTELHSLGWAHSIEVWDPDGALVGGLYGVAIGGLFAGESMFHRARDASKVALVRLVEELSDGLDRLIDVQWRTDHLAGLGVVEIGRREYLRRLPVALALPLPSVFD